MSSSKDDEKKKARTETDPLREEVHAIVESSKALRVAVACYDYAKSGSGPDDDPPEPWHYNGDEWFHAASTIKVPVLLGVFRAIQEKRYSLALKARVHVRNLFTSAAPGEGTFRVAGGRDANSVVPQNLGKTMRVEDLAYHMITTSSNLATNLLIDAVGVDYIAGVLRELGLSEGVEFHRGVEDDAAFHKEINNECTALGMLAVLRTIEERRGLNEELSRKMLDIMHDQKFRSGIPAGLPDDVKVAHKTGEISTVQHDAGIVYVADRDPYALVVLTEWKKSRSNGRSETISRISKAVFRHLTGREA